MYRRKLRELNLMDDFLFNKMLTYPGIGDKFSRMLIQTIFGYTPKDLLIIPQKVYYGADVQEKGIRMDVYLEELSDSETDHVIYDLEPNFNKSLQEKKNLPKRTRYYHAMIDSSGLPAGGDYTNLKKVIVVMLLSTDPFGLDRMVYTIQRACMEEPGMPYKDDSATIYLYCHGKAGNPPRELKELLYYMADTRDENATNQQLKELQKMVDTVKQDKGVSLEFMKIFEREHLIREEGREEGIKEGRKESQKEIMALKQQIEYLQTKLSEKAAT